MDKIINKLIEKGKIIKVEGNMPLYLNNPKKIWIIKEGIVDIFSVTLKQSEPFGYRSYLFTADKNNILFGIDFKNNKRNIGLIAVGLHGTLVVEIDINKLTKFIATKPNKYFFINQFDNWVNNTSAGLFDKKMPKNLIELKVTDKLEVKSKEMYKINEKIFWIKHKSGKSQFRDFNDVTFSKDDTFIAITTNSWINIIENGEVIVTDTEKLVNKNLQNTINIYNDKLLDNIIRINRLNENSDKEKIFIRKDNDDNIIKSSLKKLAQPLLPEAIEDVQEYIAEGVLFAVCKAVGNAAGLTVRLPSKNKDSLNEIIKASRFKTRQVILKDEWWKSDSGPLLGYLEKDELPVALLPVNKTQYEIYDVSKNEHILIDKEVKSRLKPFAYSFYPPLPEEKIDIIKLLKFAFEHTWKGDTAIAIITGVLGGVIGLIIPYATGIIFDSILPSAERGQLLQLGMFLIVTAFASFTFQITQSIALLRLESKMDATVQASVWDRIMSLPIPFFKRFSTGDLATRGISINTIRKILAGATKSTIFSGLFSIFYLLMLFYYNQDLAIKALIMAIISIIFVVSMGHFSLKNERKIAEYDGGISGLLLQIVYGVTKFRVSNSEKRGFSIWAKKYAEKRKYRYKSELFSNNVTIFNGIFPVLASMVLFYLYVNTKDLLKELTTGNFLAFNSAFVAFTTAMTSMSSTIIESLGVIPLYERAKPILEELPEYNESKSDPGDLEGEIEVGHINFRYDSDGPLILNDVSMHFKPQEFVAIVGPSGSGKSTLLRLLLGFETPELGSIYYDGQDISDLDIRAVRSQLGVVLQNGKIIFGDIYSNIIGSAANLTINDAWKAAELAGFADDIKEMPMGMYTVVSEGGSTLSGGQRQRLLIARAIVNKPRIIYFDEATSALDNRTQEVVSKSLEGLNATRVVIAHRLSTIKNADKIYVMVNGSVVQEGTYSELINVDGPFLDLAKRQVI